MKATWNKHFPKSTERPRRHPHAPKFKRPYRRRQRHLEERRAAAAALEEGEYA